MAGAVGIRSTACRSFVLTHEPPNDYPRGPSNLTFVTDGIASAIEKARAVAGGKDIKLGGASPGKQAFAAGLCDEILVHIAPYLLGGGVRLVRSAARMASRSRRSRSATDHSRRTSGTESDGRRFRAQVVTLEISAG